MKKKILVSILLCASLASQAVAAKTFTDLDVSHWSYPYVQAVQSGIDGYPDGTFRPDTPVTRAEFSKIFLSALGVYDSSHDTNSYQNWYEPYQLIMEPYIPSTENGFDADAMLTRGDTALAIYNMLSMDTDGAYSTASAQVYSDYNQNDERTNRAIAFCTDMGIMTGKGGYFDASSGLTRAEICVIISRINNIFGVNIPDNTLPPEQTPNPDSGNQSGTEQLSDYEFKMQVLELVNQERAANGLNSLAWSDDAAAVAQAHAEDMASRDYFNHSTPEGLSPSDRINNTGISWTRNAENIAAGQQTPQEVMDAWMNSPGHRRNILTPELENLGIGIARGGSYGIYWVQVFITP